ncbi:MAG: aconitase X, partial [Chloroflexota bacterium]
QRYAELAPKTAVSLITIGCPQASMGELRATAQLLQGHTLAAAAPPLWVFTSAQNKAIAEKTGIAAAIRAAGALLLENTCPEVVPYDPTWVHHVLTNSMKAEHYIKSGLNGIPTSVMKLADCVAVALGEKEGWGEERGAKRADATGKSHVSSSPTAVSSRPLASGSFAAAGHGLPSQADFTITGVAFVTDTPVTFLGFVNRETGVIEEEGHPANGESMAGKIAIFPKGSGSTVAPYVLLELHYRGMAPIAIVNTTIDQQSAPACSLEGIPYAYQFDDDIIANINQGDMVELKRTGNHVTLRVIHRIGDV